MKKLKILLFGCILISTQVFSSQGGWMPIAKNIESIVVEGGSTGSSALIVIEGGVPADFIPTNCSSEYNTVDLTTDHGKSVLSIALAAKMAGKPIKLALACAGSRPFITHIRIM